MPKKKDKIVYEVTLKLHESGKVKMSEKGHEILCSREVATHLNIGILETMLMHMKMNVIRPAKEETT